MLIPSQPVYANKISDLKKAGEFAMLDKRTVERREEKEASENIPRFVTKPTYPYLPITAHRLVGASEALEDKCSLERP